MPIQRLNPSLLQRPERCRFALGLSTSSSGRQIRASLVAARGQALDMRLEIAAHETLDVPRRLVRLFRELRSANKHKPAEAATLAAELAELKAVLLGDLAARAPQFASRADVVGEIEPGLWSRPRGGLLGYLPLSDPARLADLSGISVIDAFPARDLAQEGRGGPLSPLADWLLLHHTSKTRVLVDLGPAVRVTYLAASRDATGAQRVTSFVAGPGMRLIDAFARKFTEGRERFDLGGHLAVQGARIDEILADWLADLQRAESPVADLPVADLPAAQSPLAHPQLASAAPARRSVSQYPIAGLVRSGLEKSVGRWSVRDLLCTSVYLVAEVAARAVLDRLPAEPALDEIIITGGGQHHGLLMQCLAERLDPLPLVSDLDLGLASAARDGAIAAILALLHLDQTPACPTALSGAHTPRVLGRLTPGAPQSWQRLLQAMSARTSAAVSLRSAI